MKKLKFPRDLLQRIKEDPDYVLIFFRIFSIRKKEPLYFPRLRGNGDYTMLCPLHAEKTPSLRLNILTNYYKCFGCGNHGDIFTLLQEVYKISFLEAVIFALHLKTDPRCVYENDNKWQLKIPYKEYGWEPLHTNEKVAKTEDEDFSYPF